MSIVDELELSIRSSNVLRTMGVETMDDFMSLTKERFLAQRNAGARSWKEIVDLQRSLGARNVEIERQLAWQKFCSLLGAANDLMVAYPHMRVCLAQDGCLVAAATSLSDGAKRF